MPRTGLTRVRTDFAVDNSTVSMTTLASVSPSVPFDGSTMARKPPSTHDNCKAVSERANADVRTCSTASRWMTESRPSLLERLTDVGDQDGKCSSNQPEPDRRDHAHDDDPDQADDRENLRLSRLQPGAKRGAEHTAEGGCGNDDAEIDSRNEHAERMAANQERKKQRQEASECAHARTGAQHRGHARSDAAQGRQHSAIQLLQSGLVGYRLRGARCGSPRSGLTRRASTQPQFALARVDPAGQSKGKTVPAR